MFTASLFVITINWKQSKYPLIDEWIKTVVYSYNETPLNNKKNNLSITCCSMDESQYINSE